jgi:anti-sigma B factor antagonist
MFEIQFGENGEVVLEGRLDAAQAARAREFLEGVAESRVVDFTRLEYISSAGLGVLLRVQKRLKGNGDELTLTGLNHHIRDVFRFAGLDQVFKIET